MASQWHCTTQDRKLSRSAQGLIMLLLASWLNVPYGNVTDPAPTPNPGPGPTDPVPRPPDPRPEPPLPGPTPPMPNPVPPP